jgi:hypothetical protein
MGKLEGLRRGVYTRRDSELCQCLTNNVGSVSVQRVSLGIVYKVNVGCTFESPVIQPALVEHVAFIGWHNGHDASNVSISVRRCSIQVREHDRPSDAIRVVDLGKSFGKSRRGAVLW